jgi:short-subunit dehydrogenase
MVSRFLTAGMRDARLFRLGAMSAESVARIGYKSFRRGKVIAVTGWRNKLLIQTVRFSPRFMVRKIAQALNK